MNNINNKIPNTIETIHEATAKATTNEATMNEVTTNEANTTTTMTNIHKKIPNTTKITYKTTTNINHPNNTKTLSLITNLTTSIVPILNSSPPQHYHVHSTRHHNNWKTYLDRQNQP
jgi:hypothetical protein